MDKHMLEFSNLLVDAYKSKKVLNILDREFLVVKYSIDTEIPVDFESIPGFVFEQDTVTSIKEFVLKSKDGFFLNLSIEEGASSPFQYFFGDILNAKER